MAGNRLERRNLWAKMRRNFIKWWQVFYIPIQRFIEKGSQRVEREDYLEMQKAEYERQQEQLKAAKEEVVQNLTAKAEQGVAAKQALEKEQQSETIPEPVEEVDLLTADDSTLSAEELAAKEILARLQAEADADIAKKQAEIEAARLHAENIDDAAYNASTHSFSGNYGKGPVDDATRDAVDSIINAHNDDISAMIEAMKQD